MTQISEKIKLVAETLQPAANLLSEIYLRKTNGRIVFSKYWNYYNTEILEELLTEFDKVKLSGTYFAELGSGFPIISHALKQIYKDDVYVECYELQKDIYHLSKEYFPTIKILNTNILDLGPATIQRFDILFYWRPIANSDLHGTFLNRLCLNTSKEQKIMFNSKEDEQSEKFFENSKIFEKINTHETIQVYERR